MTETINDQSITKSLKLLSNGFKNEFATFVVDDRRTAELLMELSIEFVDANVPITQEDYDTELAMMLMESLDIVAR